MYCQGKKAGFLRRFLRLFNKLGKSACFFPGPVYNEIFQRGKAVSGLGKRIKRFFIMQESGVLILTVLFIIVVSSRNRVFLSSANIFDVLRASGFTLITTVGMTMVLISGGLDLSVGSVLALGGITCSAVLAAGFPLIIGVLAGICAGALVGMVNAFIIVRMGISSLMVTLGTQYIARGVCVGITKGVPIYPLPQGFQISNRRTGFGVCPIL